MINAMPTNDVPMPLKEETVDGGAELDTVWDNIEVLGTSADNQ